MNDFFARGDLSRCIPILFDTFDVSSVGHIYIYISRTRQSREKEKEKERGKDRVCDEGRREGRRSH